MQRSQAPIQQPMVDNNGRASQLWVRWFAGLPLEGILNAVAEPDVSDNQARFWMASVSGTKDGVAYGQGDILMTIKVGGISKTKMVADYSAL
jgi:hypothetical protein